MGVGCGQAASALVDRLALDLVDPVDGMAPGDRHELDMGVSWV